MYFSLIILFSSISKPATTKMNPLSLHDALPIFVGIEVGGKECSLHFNRPAIFPVGRLLDPDLAAWHGLEVTGPRSEEHTSELQSRENLVCRLLLEKKNNKQQRYTSMHARTTIAS